MILRNFGNAVLPRESPIVSMGLETPNVALRESGSQMALRRQSPNIVPPPQPQIAPK